MLAVGVRVFDGVVHIAAAVSEDVHVVEIRGVETQNLALVGASFRLHGAEGGAVVAAVQHLAVIIDGNIRVTLQPDNDLAGFQNDLGDVGEDEAEVLRIVDHEVLGLVAGDGAQNLFAHQALRVGEVMEEADGVHVHAIHEFEPVGLIVGFVHVTGREAVAHHNDADFPIAVRTQLTLHGAFREGQRRVDLRSAARVQSIHGGQEAVAAASCGDKALKYLSVCIELLKRDV